MANNDQAHAVSAALWQVDRVLLIRRAREPFRDHWTLPGGRREAGETEEQAVAREVREELGLTVEALQHATTISVHANPTFELKVFTTKAFSGRIEPNGEVAEWRWASLPDLAGLRTTPDLEAVVRASLAVFGSRG
jgi:8-oxo-dGTP diphosphatase